jgi:hypothetical protein
MLRTAEASDIFMHEIVHALTVKALKTPITIEDIELATATNKLYSLFESEMKGSQL